MGFFTSYTTKDLFYYGGFIAGAGIGNQTLVHLGFSNQWVVLIGTILCGIVVGYLLERIHSGPQAPGDE